MKAPTPNQFVVVAERSGGNETVGDMWLETATFSPEATLAEVWEWSRDIRTSGKVILTADQSSGSQDKG